MKCNLQCPYSKPNGRDVEGNQSIICECRRWFMTDLDDCIENFTEKNISQLRNLWEIKTMPGEKFKVFTEIPSREENIVNMITGEPLTINETCQLLNSQDKEIQLLKVEIKELKEKKS